MAALTVQSSGFYPDADQKTIPVVHNIIRDKDLWKFEKDQKTYPSSEVRKLSLNRVLRLISDKHSKHLYERHHREIQKLTLHYKHGIHLRDATLLFEIFKKCHENICFDHRYEELTVAVVKLFGQPFCKSKVPEEEIYLQKISELFSDIGQIIELSSEKIQTCLANTISTLYTTEGEKRTVDKEHVFIDTMSVSTPFIKTSVENSRICKSIAEILSKLEDETNRFTVLQAIRTLSNSDLNCDDILKTDAAYFITTSLSRDVSNYRLLFIKVEILLNLLEHGNALEFSRQLGSEACLKSLLFTLVHQINHCPSRADRELRNDILVVIMLIAIKCPNAPYVTSGISKMMSLYSTYPELPSRHEQVQYVKLHPSPEDFELKKLLLSTLVVLSQDKSSMKVMQEHHVLLGLFSYVKPINDQFESMWCVSEFEELQLHALSVLSTLSPLCVNEYIACQGSTRILELLDWCVGGDDFGGHGNSYHGTGGRGSKRAQMRYCIRFIRSICSTGDEQVCLDFTDQGLIAQLVAILNSCSQSSDTNDDVDIELQCDMLFILATLCDGDVHRKELFGERGVNILVQYLNGYVKMRNGPFHNNRLVLAVTDCIWSTVIDCFMNEVTFLEKEGAFLLLDLLEVCSQHMQNIVLNTVLDLVENKNVIPHIKLWRGENEKTIGKLLIELWREEEEKLGVQRDEFGVIADCLQPLMTQQQREQGVIPLPASFSSSAIVDVSDNLRGKIFSMFSKIGFNNVSGLCSLDYVILSVIEKYLDFKTLEIWQEIKTELELQHIEPIESDKEGISAIISTFQNKAVQVQSVQRTLINENNEQNLLDEQEYYQKIKDSFKQQNKENEDWTSFVDRTSDYFSLQKARERQLQSIDRSRLLSSSVEDSTRERYVHHETLDRNLSTTTFCGRNIFVKSMRYGTTREKLSLKNT